SSRNHARMAHVKYRGLHEHEYRVARPEGRVAKRQEASPQPMSNPRCNGCGAASCGLWPPGPRAGPPRSYNSAPKIGRCDVNATASPNHAGLLARLRRVRALVRKESYQIVRDPSSIAIGIVLPVILILLFGYGVSLDVDHTPIAVVLE